MTRTKAFLVTLVLIFTVLIISGCLTLFSAEELRSVYTPVEVGIIYSEESDDCYRFTPPASGRYIISIIGTDCDLSWTLCGHPKPDEKNILVMQSNDGIIDDGTRTPPLKAGQEYYLVIIEDRETYELSIRPE